QSIEHALPLSAAAVQKLCQGRCNSLRLQIVLNEFLCDLAARNDVDQSDMWNLYHSPRDEIRDYSSAVRHNEWTVSDCCLEGRCATLAERAVRSSQNSKRRRLHALIRTARRIEINGWRNAHDRL